MTPAIIIVGADKGGVGKTTVSRLLLDYLASRNTPTRAFDTESPRGTLKRFHPDSTEIVDLTQTLDQMKVLDTSQDAGARVSVIDVRAGHLGSTLETLKEIGFLDAVRNGEFTFALFHVLGSSIASLDEIQTIAPYVGDASYYLVRNHINDTTFFDWDPATHRNYFDGVKSAGDISIPKLNEHAYEQVELTAIPFSKFVDNKTSDNQPANYSFVLRGYVRAWIRQVEAELDRINLVNTISRNTHG